MNMKNKSKIKMTVIIDIKIQNLNFLRYKLLKTSKKKLSGKIRCNQAKADKVKVLVLGKQVLRPG